MSNKYLIDKNKVENYVSILANLVVKIVAKITITNVIIKKKLIVSFNIWIRVTISLAILGINKKKLKNLNHVMTITITFM